MCRVHMSPIFIKLFLKIHAMGPCSNSMSKVKNCFVFCHCIFIVIISVTPSLRRSVNLKWWQAIGSGSGVVQFLAPVH